jgi:hypothetical protein
MTAMQIANFRRDGMTEDLPIDTLDASWRNNRRDSPNSSGS